MPELLEGAELEALPLVDYYPHTLFEYSFRPGGDLEFMDVMGKWRRVRGCSGNPDLGIHAFNENLLELDYLAGLLIDALPVDTSLSQLYQTNERFSFLVNECLEANHINLRWFNPRMLTWLLFDRVEGGYQVRAALRVLNDVPESKYSTGGGGFTLESQNEYMALIATYCGGDLHRAHALAKAVAGRDLMPQLDALGYFSLDNEARHKRDVQLWAAEMRGQRPSRQVSSSAPSNAPTEGATASAGALPANRPRVRAVGRQGDSPQGAPVTPQPQAGKGVNDG